MNQEQMKILESLLKTLKQFLDGVLVQVQSGKQKSL